MVPYITRNELELLFGVENIKRWADLDGDNNTQKITDRVNFAILSASSYLDTILRGRVYKDIVVDPMVKRLAAMVAGLNLYDGREIIDGDPTSDKMSVIRKHVEDTIVKIRRGQIILSGNRATNSPEISQSTQEVPTIPLFATDKDPFKGIFHP